MSKKSRKRNRKILKALAVGLGAAALMRGRNKGAVSTVGQPTGVDRVADKPAHLGETFHKKVVPAPKKIIPRSGKYDQAGEFLKKINDPNAAESSMQFITPSTKKYSLLAGNAKPPSMRGGAKRAEGYQPIYPPTGNINQFDYRAKGGRAGHKSGGRVGVGKAKRGFGRALKKGK